MKSDHGSRKIEARIKARNMANIRHGRAPGWADEALDFYLDGCSYADIQELYECSLVTASAAVAKAALIRLLMERGADRMEDVIK